MHEMVIMILNYKVMGMLTVIITCSLVRYVVWFIETARRAATDECDVILMRICWSKRNSRFSHAYNRFSTWCQHESDRSTVQNICDDSIKKYQIYYMLVYDFWLLLLRTIFNMLKLTVAKCYDTIRESKEFCSSLKFGGNLIRDFWYVWSAENAHGPSMEKHFTSAGYFGWKLSRNLI